MRAGSPQTPWDRSPSATPGVTRCHLQPGAALRPGGAGAAVFYDAGNVFVLPSDLSLDLRHSLGTGLRWDSPIGLLRLDLGFPLARREGEKAYRLFFSLGQAF